MSFFKQSFDLLKTTAQGWSKDNASFLAASLAYYTTFAIAPLLVIAVAVAGFVFSDAAVEGQIVSAIQDTVGREAAVVIQNLIIQTQESGAGVIATIISVAVLLLGASGLFINIQKALNIIWGIAPPPDAGVIGVIKQRLLAFGMVIGVGLLIILSFILSTIVSFLEGLLTEWLPTIGGAIPELGFIISLLLLTLAFAMIFKLLPNAEMAWRDVLLGALVTAVLFTFGRFLISLYLRSGGVSSTYGAAGSLVVILLFVYYSMQIILFGAEFTQVYANRYGSKVRPADDAQIIVRREISQEEANKMAEPPPAPAPTLPAAYPIPPLPAPSPPARQREKQIAAGLIGLAAGLLLSFLTRKR